MITISSTLDLELESIKMTGVYYFSTLSLPLLVCLYKRKGKEKERMAKILKRNESRPRLSVRVLTLFHCIICFLLLLLLLHFIIIIGIFINIYL